MQICDTAEVGPFELRTKDNRLADLHALTRVSVADYLKAPISSMETRKYIAAAIENVG